MRKEVLPEGCGGVCVKRLTNCIGARHKRRYTAFTLIELVVVIGLILILTGLVLSTVGYARKKGARARAETEIAAMAAALESYKSDNAVYPRDASSTDTLDARASGNPSAYQTASLYLYKQLSGDTNANLQPPPGAKIYFTFKAKPPQIDGTACGGMLSITRNNGTYTVNYICDPFGNSYGYSTIQAATQDTTKGYNPTFDLWSTSGLTASPGNPDTITPQWIKNW